MAVYGTILSLLARHSVPFREYAHGPILSYEDAEREKALHGWDGTESKSVFMTDKKGRYFAFVTVAGAKVDFARMKEITGARLSLASREEVGTVAGCVPWNVAPFGLDVDGLVTLVDEGIFSRDRYLFSPGVSDRTIELVPTDLRPIFEEMGAKFIPTP